MIPFRKILTPLWSINTNRGTQKFSNYSQFVFQNPVRDYYSCSIDSVLDMLIPSVFDWRQDVDDCGHLIQMIWNLKKIKEEITYSSDSWMTKRLKISEGNEIVWDWLIQHDKAGFGSVQKGSDQVTIENVPKFLTETEKDKKNVLHTSCYEVFGVWQ